MSDLNLTFGIELEFICVYPIDCFEYRYLRRKNEWKYIKPGKRFHNAGHALYYYLEEAGIPVNIGRARHGDVATFSEWQVMSDCLELSEQEERYKPGGFREEAIEIASRKLSFYGDDWHRELRKVLKVLAQIERVRHKNFIAHAAQTISDLAFLAIRMQVRDKYKYWTSCSCRQQRGKVATCHD